jgi:hypothetical protein
MCALPSRRQWVAGDDLPRHWNDLLAGKDAKKADKSNQRRRR